MINFTTNCELHCGNVDIYQSLYPVFSSNVKTYSTSLATCLQQQTVFMLHKTRENPPTNQNVKTFRRKFWHEWQLGDWWRDEGIVGLIPLFRDGITCKFVHSTTLLLHPYLYPLSCLPPLPPPLPLPLLWTGGNCACDLWRDKGSSIIGDITWNIC